MSLIVFLYGNVFGRRLKMESSLLCLAVALYFESGNQSLVGKVAVGKVIFKRVEEQFRGDTTLCEVVQHKGQFSFYWDGKPETIPKENKVEVKAWEESYLVASAMLAEGGGGAQFVDLTDGATHYHAAWMDSYPCWSNPNYYIKIDDHMFIPKVKQCN